MATATRERLLLQTNCFWNMHIATFKFKFIRELQISSLTCKCNIKCSVTSLLICTDNIIIPYLARGLWRSFLQQVYILFLRSTLLLLRSVAHVWPLLLPAIFSMILNNEALSGGWGICRSRTHFYPITVTHHFE